MLTATKQRVAGVLGLWTIGAAVGIALRAAEPSAAALVIECDKIGIEHELESFRRLSGTRNEELERAWWLPLAVLYAGDPSLGLRVDDPDAEETIIGLESEAP